MEKFKPSPRNWQAFSRSHRLPPYNLNERDTSIQDPIRPAAHNKLTVLPHRNDPLIDPFCSNFKEPVEREGRERLSVKRSASYWRNFFSVEVYTIHPPIESRTERMKTGENSFRSKTAPYQERVNKFRFKFHA